MKERKGLLSNAVSHHGILPRNETILAQGFLSEVRRTVISFIRGRPQSKIQLVLICEMVKTDPITGNITVVETPSFRSFQEPVYNSTDLEAVYDRMVRKMMESFSAFLKDGSGWMFKRIIRLEITPAKNKPVKGSS